MKTKYRMLAAAILAFAPLAAHARPAHSVSVHATQLTVHDRAPMAHVHTIAVRH